MLESGSIKNQKLPKRIETTFLRMMHHDFICASERKSSYGSYENLGVIGPSVNT